ncbi:MAG TPA: hypothetical protein VLB85_07385 [Acidimicrobiia bacterium]|nr:hypothetical protein [Acidimicrobiia bacterium]
METQPGEFYLGGLTNQETGERGEALVYDSDDLVTHGVIVGMTGSGKTGLGIDLLEEALLSDIPCLIIDPKGDMGNLRLVFPDFAPADFAPWIDPAEAERQGNSIEEQAAATADMWKEGLASWEIGPDRMRAVRDGSAVTIYTPGSTAGVPLNILGSLAAPPLSWDDHAEDLRDEIEGFVSSLLVLAGIEADPVSSPSHILLATIIEEEWKAGRDLDLARLVGMIPEPPFRKLGVFELEAFYPKQDRTQLAMQLNGLLASPSFAAWLEGNPLEISDLLTGGDRTRAAIIYLAHLSETERQFVVTLLLAKLITWMRRQSGTGKLRALVYMDEVFGFAPPVAEPPAKKQILTILKQARAFGVGMVLATQNPVDLDYKAMSNAGTWMVGRLQTENDKKRILEGLADAGGMTDTAQVDVLISNLDKRQFVLRQTGEAEPRVFGTRWAMSYLAGPLDRTRVGMLTQSEVGSRKSEASDSEVSESEVGSRKSQAPEAEVPETAEASPSEELDGDTVPVAPQVADGVSVATLAPAAPWAKEVGGVPMAGRYKAVAAATVRLLYDDRYAEVEHRQDYEAVIDPLTSKLVPDSVRSVDHDERDFQPGTPAAGAFLLPDAPVGDGGYWKSLAASLRDYLIREQRFTVWKNPELSIYSRVGETEEEFRARCQEVAEDAADADLVKLKDRYATRIDRVRNQISKADRRVAELEADVTARKQQEVVSGVGDVLGSFLGGRSKSAAIRRAANRRSQTQRTTADLETAHHRLTEEQQELADLEVELAEELAQIVEAWEAKAERLEPVEIGLEANDVEVADLKLVWVPVARARAVVSGRW